MRSTVIAIGVVAVACVVGAAGIARVKAQHAEHAMGALPVAGFPAAQDVAGAHELPDPKMDYKVIFAVGQSAPKPGEVNPMLESVALYVNTLAKHGVPAEHRHIVVMFHQRTPDFDLVMSQDAFKARYSGQENKNVAIIHALKQAGVDLRVCGQGLGARKIEASQVNPDIQVDLWAMTSIVNLQTRGYVRVG